MRSSGLVLLGVLVAIAVLGSIALIQDPNNVQIGYHPSLLSTTTSSTNPSNDLELKMSLNATSIPKGGAVNISVAEYNTLTVVNNVTTSTNWPVTGLSDGPCGTLNEPIGFEVFGGYYTVSNISSAKSLELYSPGFYSCPMILSGISSYRFSPHNSTAAIYGSCGSSLCFTNEISSGVVVRGHWGSGIGSSFNTLAPDVYTVVAGDEWGTLTFLYFIVG